MSSSSSPRWLAGQAWRRTDDVKVVLESIIEDPAAKIVFMNMALCDYKGVIVTGGSDQLYPTHAKKIEEGKHAERLKTAHGVQTLHLHPAEKLIGMLRKERKDIFVVGFKTTTEANEDEQYLAGLELLKKNSLKPRARERHRHATQHDHRARGSSLLPDERS
jgi:hypothetical protein